MYNALWPHPLGRFPYVEVDRFLPLSKSSQDELPYSLILFMDFEYTEFSQKRVKGTQRGSIIGKKNLTRSQRGRKEKQENCWKRGKCH